MDYTIKNRINDILTAHISFPNGSVNKQYKALLDLEKWNMADITLLEWNGLEEIGLVYNEGNNTIEGIPTESGDHKIKLVFSVADSPKQVKVINLIINPDPRSMWKDLPSDVKDPYWKQDDVHTAGPLYGKHAIAASKRGRSHKNTGAFRDDHFELALNIKNNWSVVAVADGAGSSPFSRQGARIACEETIRFFQQYFEENREQELEEIAASDREKINLVAGQHMYQAIKHVYEQINAEAEKHAAANPALFNDKRKSILEYYHTTLIFVAFKKFDFGYLILSFGVGDCPIVLLHHDEAQLLNQLDVGEFGGGTRFITQPEIFHSKEIPVTSRFKVTIQPDFSYLFLMTDGIYDPKFEVVYNLQNAAHWQQFMQDLDGNNEEKVKIDFKGDCREAARSLFDWMDFWSPGNHDDRTMVIIY
ncbi:PP2C family serine/threonine-protein phosphatase [Chitinophaga sancti]|uniref:PP2C family serine/threonine-protein phosphatase n=1 Tax=Chitinophaga sancti TaxID=1004 RepID=UPI003F7B2952